MWEKLQHLIPIAALIVTAAALSFAVMTAREQGNAALVAIGVRVLRTDPTKDSQVAPAREWALDLIDANTGGVKFSPQARTELLGRRLSYAGTFASLPAIPPQLSKPCKQPAEVPKNNGGLSAGAVERLSAQDRAELASCRTKLQAITKFYQALRVAYDGGYDGGGDAGGGGGDTGGGDSGDGASRHERN